MKEIGGFFGLELSSSKDQYHLDAIRLNSGRNALKYILLQRKPRKVLIPYYICESVIEPIRDLGIEYEYYSINEKFEPILEKRIESTDYLLYVNYFGINDKQVQQLTCDIKNLIVDNTQAFFSKPLAGVDTFYSPRKFFGVADGGFAYTNVISKIDLEQDISYDKYEHLLKRIDTHAQESYSQYVKNEENISKQPIRKMSKITEVILQNIDYEFVVLRRNDNFKYLHSSLSNVNKLNIDLTQLQAPMIYPLLIQDEDLRNFLIENKIYVATYWKEVLDIVGINTVEYEFSKYLIPLPIDQRYDVSDMKIIIELIRNFKGSKTKPC